MKRYVRRTVPKVETKQQWVHHNEVSLNTLSQGYLSNGPAIAQGNINAARISNVIHATGLHMKGVLNNNSGSESLVRALVVGYAAQGDPSLNIFRNAVTGATAAISAVNGLDAMYFPVNKVDYHVYYDKLIRVAGSATGNASANVKTFSKFIKLNRRKIEYKGNTWGFGNQNWMYSIIWIAADANDDTTTGTVVELSMLERFYFQDA